MENFSGSGKFQWKMQNFAGKPKKSCWKVRNFPLEGGKLGKFRGKVFSLVNVELFDAKPFC